MTIPTDPPEKPTDPAALFQLLDECLATTVRGSPQDLDAHLLLHSNQALSGTKTTVRCHVLQFDGNQRPKVEALARHLAKQVVDYALPRAEVARAQQEFANTKSTQSLVELVTKAKSLFTDIKNTGEGGELLLYLLIERFLQIPQLICKMSLKTNPNVHFHGVDGIHAKVDPTCGKFLIYWGESKLYQNITAAVTACLESIEKFLNSNGAAEGAAERDIQLLRDNVDLHDPAAQQAILALLDPDNPLHNKIEYRGACLVGFDFDAYPNKPMEKTIEELREEVTKLLPKWLADFNTKIIAKPPLETFVLEVFLLPFPSVEAFRAAFLAALGIQ